MNEQELQRSDTEQPKWYQRKLLWIVVTLMASIWPLWIGANALWGFLER